MKTKDTFRVCCTVPIRTVSEANWRGHWAEQHKRKKTHRSSAAYAAFVVLSGHEIPQKLTVKLTRVGPREMDGDNLQSALKACRDGIADAIGIDDGSKRITWQYEQRKGSYNVEVEITGG